MPLIDFQDILSHFPTFLPNLNYTLEGYRASDVQYTLPHPVPRSIYLINQFYYLCQEIRHMTLLNSKALSKAGVKSLFWYRHLYKKIKVWEWKLSFSKCLVEFQMDEEMPFKNTLQLQIDPKFQVIT